MLTSVLLPRHSRVRRGTRGTSVLLGAVTKALGSCSLGGREIIPSPPVAEPLRSHVSLWARSWSGFEEEESAFDIESGSARRHRQQLVPPTTVPLGCNYRHHGRRCGVWRTSPLGEPRGIERATAHVSLCSSSEPRRFPNSTRQATQAAAYPQLQGEDCFGTERTCRGKSLWMFGEDGPRAVCARHSLSFNP